MKNNYFCYRLKVKKNQDRIIYPRLSNQIVKVFQKESFGIIYEHLSKLKEPKLEDCAVILARAHACEVPLL